MKHLLQYFIIITQIFYSGMFFAEEVHYELVSAPNLQDYRSLFFTFGHSTSQTSLDDFSVLDDLLNQEFDREVEVYQNKPESVFLLKATNFDEVVGYFSCQMLLSTEFSIRQMAFDVDRYGDSLLKDFLLAIFDAIPNVEKISVACPIACKALVDLLLNFGFVPTNDLASSITDTFSLSVHSKCGMCQVLYGEDFWDQDEESFVLESDLNDDSDEIDRNVKNIDTDFVDVK